jgi:hypothetical protein
MVSVDTLEGVINGVLWFHYDIGNDVLYLRHVDHRQTEVVCDETPEGIFVARPLDSDQIVGLEIVDWWKRYGNGPLPDSVSQMAKMIEPWSGRVAA